MTDLQDWRRTILEGSKVACGGSGASAYHTPVNSMAALLGNLLMWHEDGISDAEWGERFYQWGIAVGISKSNLHTIVYAMLNIARSITWVGEDDGTGSPARATQSYSPTKSKLKGAGLSDFITAVWSKGGDFVVPPLQDVPGLGVATAAALRGDRLGAGWEPPSPGQPSTPGRPAFKIPITSFPALMGHFLQFHEEGLDAQRWGDRFAIWGREIGVKATFLHPITCALLTVAELIPMVPSETTAGLDRYSEGVLFDPSKSHTRADVLAEFIEWTDEGAINVLDVPNLGEKTARVLARPSYKMPAAEESSEEESVAALETIAAQRETIAAQRETIAAQREESQAAALDQIDAQKQELAARIAATKEEHLRAQRANSEQLAQLKRMRRTAAGRAKAATNKERLIAIWAIHNPAKIPTADAVLSKYAGQEDALFAKLEAKYGAAPGAPKPRSKPDEKSCCESCAIC